MEFNLNSAAFPLSLEPAPTSIWGSPPFATIACLASSDVLSVAFSLLLAWTVRDHLIGSVSTPIPGVILPALMLILCSFMVSGLYPGVSLNPVEELRLCTLSITLSFLALWAATFFLHDISPSRLVYVLAYLFVAATVPACRVFTRRIFSPKRWWGSPIAILGFGTTGKLLYEKLTNNPSLGLKPYAVLDDDPQQFAQLKDPLFYGPLSQCLEIAANHRISYGVVCMPGLCRDELLNFIERYGQCFGHLLVIPDMIGITSLGISAKEVGGIVGLEVKQQLLRPSSKFFKRALDLAAVLLAAPFVLLAVAVCAIFIKLEDGGKVFYANERIGYRGKRFDAWKLRSMVVDGERVLEEHISKNPSERIQWQTTQKLKRDPRITRVGRFIRKTSVDELPQFWNVLKGDMSVVGPRPILEHQVVMYGPSFSLYRQVRPGITGLWQVSGRNHLPFDERVKLDKYVIQNWSVWLDLYILARTAGVLLTADGAY